MLEMARRVVRSSSATRIFFPTAAVIDVTSCASTRLLICQMLLLTPTPVNRGRPCPCATLRAPGLCSRMKQLFWVLASPDRRAGERAGTRQPTIQRRPSRVYRPFAKSLVYRRPRRLLQTSQPGLGNHARLHREEPVSRTYDEF